MIGETCDKKGITVLKYTILNNEELKKYICGAVYYDERDGLIPYRFTKEQISVR